MNPLSRVLLILLLAFATKAWSTHIVGGEIYYDCLGNNNYRVTLKVYRDCFNGQAPFDNPASVGVFTSSGALVTTLSLAFPGSTLMPITQTNPCFSPPQANVCVEEAIYSDVINLPPIAGGYYLAYQRCCRNNTIQNLSSPSTTGSTYMAHIPPSSLAACNSSPRYNNFPPIAVCAGVPLTFDHSATDPDGDSLAYELCTPYHGADQLNPMPVPPAAPPYPAVLYNPPYSGTYPMSSNPALSIDPITGLLTGTPNSIGQWVVGVCVKEYRNGQLLSINKRDFQFNVVNCQPITVVSNPTPQQNFCFGPTVNFTQSSTGAMNYFWDFGDPSTTSDTSVLASPSYTYNTSGTFNVMLIVNPNTICADTAFTTFQVYPLLQPSFTAPPGQCFTGNSYNFTSGGNFAGTGTFNWNFGSNANPSTSSQQNPSGVSFTVPGNHLVTLTVSENNCTESYTDTVVVYPMPTADFNASPVSGCVPFTVQFSDSSIAGTPINYLWDFGDGSPPSTQANPVHTYTQTGVYDVSLTISTTNGCIATHTFNVPGMVTVNSLPTAGFTISPTETSIFNPLITMTDQSQNSISCNYSFGDGYGVSNECDYEYAYPEAGVYTITQVVFNENGCTDTAYATVDIKHEYRFYIPNAFTPEGDGLNDVFKPAIMGVTDYRFLIFDRWGELIYEGNNHKEGWDGTYKGRKCQQDVYVYRLDFRDLVDFKQHSYIGRVTLIR